MSDLTTAIFNAIIRAWEIIKQALNGIAKQTGPDGKTPTFAAKIAIGLLNFIDNLPRYWEELKGFFTDLVRIIKGIAKAVKVADDVINGVVQLGVAAFTPASTGDDSVYDEDTGELTEFTKETMRRIGIGEGGYDPQTWWYMYDNYGHSGLQVPEYYDQYRSQYSTNSGEHYAGIASAMKDNLGRMNVYIDKNTLVGSIADEVSARIGGGTVYVGGFGE